MGPCLLHHDYHIMTTACRLYAVGWRQDHQEAWAPWYRPQAYAVEWESRLLKDVWSPGR